MSRASAPWFYLRPDEQVLRREAPARAYATLVFLRLALPLTALCAAAMVALRLLPQARVDPAWTFAAWAGLLGVAALFGWRRRATSEYVVTDQRVYARTGRLVTRVHLATHDKVTDTRYRQDPLERLLSVGSLILSTAGGDLRLPGLADAAATREAAERARDAFLLRLLGEAREPPPARAEDPGAPAAPLPAWEGPRPDFVKAGDTPAWVGAPTPRAALASLQPFLGLLALLLASRALGQGAQGLGLLVPVLVVVGALATLLRLLQLRRTRYVATDRRVYARTGLVGTTVKQLTYDKITDITYRQDLVGRLLGYGTVTLATAGGQESAIHLHGLPRPLEAKERVEALRARYLGEEDA